MATIDGATEFSLVAGHRGQYFFPRKPYFSLISEGKPAAPSHGIHAQHHSSGSSLAEIKAVGAGYDILSFHEDEAAALLKSKEVRLPRAGFPL